MDKFSRNQFSGIPACSPKSLLVMPDGRSFKNCDGKQVRKAVYALEMLVHNAVQVAQTAEELSLPALVSSCLPNEIRDDPLLHREIIKALRDYIDVEQQLGTLSAAKARFLAGRLCLSTYHACELSYRKEFFERKIDEADYRQVAWQGPDGKYEVWAESLYIQHILRHCNSVREKRERFRDSMDDWFASNMNLIHHNPHIDEADVGWTLCLGICTAAEARNHEFFHKFGQKAIDLHQGLNRASSTGAPITTHAQTVVEAVTELIPSTDYRGWARGMVSLAWAQMGEETLFEQKKQCVLFVLDNHDVTKKCGLITNVEERILKESELTSIDRALAVCNFWMAREQYQQSYEFTEDDMRQIERIVSVEGEEYFKSRMSVEKQAKLSLQIGGWNVSKYGSQLNSPRQTEYRTSARVQRMPMYKSNIGTVLK